MRKLLTVFTLLVVGILLTGCVKTRDKAPVIEGVRDVEINVGESFDPLEGVIITDNEDGDLKDKAVVTGDYDVNTPGTYTITITVEDSKGQEATRTFTLTVKDPTSTNKAPVIVGLQRFQTYVIGGRIAEKDFNPVQGVVGMDPEDGIIEEVEVIGSYNLKEVGNYTVTVRVKDSAGFVVQDTVTISVQELVIPAELTDEKITVRFWHAFGEELENLIKGYAAEFMEEYKNIEIDIQSQGGYSDLLSKVTASIVAETEPTMIVGYPDHVASYLSVNAVEPLDQYVNHPKYGVDLNDFIDSYLAENRSFDVRGTLYGLPFNKSSEALIYNKTFFEEHNLKVPETWDEVEEVSKKIKEIRPEEDVYAFAYDSAANMFITLTKQWGGQYTAINEKREGILLFDNPQSRAMMAYFKGLEEKNYVTLPQAWEQDYASEPFKQEKVFMTVGSTAGIRHNIPANGEFEIGIAPIPQKSATTKAVIQQGTNLSILSSATEQEKLAAWLFIRHLTSKEVTAHWAINSGYLPVRESAYESELYQDFLNLTGEFSDPTDRERYLSATAKVAYAQRDYMFVDQPFVRSSKVRSQVDQLLTTVIVGDVSIDDAMEKALKELGEFQ